MLLTLEVSYETQGLLQRIYRQSRHHQVRQRAHCVWLYRQGLRERYVVSSVKPRG